MAAEESPARPAGRDAPRRRFRHFAQFSLRHRVLLSQLPLTISAVLVAIAVLVFEPWVATDAPHFAVGFGGIMLLTAAAWLVPWGRLRPIAYWVIPLLDFVAIAPFWSAARHALDGMSTLAAFPVFWLAWSGIRPVLAVVLGFLGASAVTWWPYLPGMAPFPTAQTDSSPIRPALVAFLMLALGVAASVLTRSMDRQSQELEASLENAATQNRMLHTVVENSDVGILVVDRNGHDVLMNPAQRRLHFLGLPAGTRDGAEKDLLLFEADGRTPIPPAERPVARALRGESFQGRVVAIGSDGSQQHLSISAAPMVNDEGSFDGTVVIFQNVTDLIGAIRAREQFVAEVTHEFRTPLTSIIGYLDLALEEQTDPVLKRYLRTSIRNAERLLTLVTNLLDASASTSTVTVQQVDLARLVRHGVDSIEVRARRSGLTLESHLPLRLEVRADAVKIAQVVDNLLSNAVKYTPRGGKITVSLRRSPEGTTAGEDDPQWAELMIRDTGIGMNEQELEGVFENFYRTEHVRKAAIPGTGLGLAISRGFVRAHGGDITVSSRRGAGSTFTVRIPVAGPAAP
ncbi:MAG: two-component sensor histidine kinase [Brachybacterium faecium]|nr:MAG: two-component sensor histidine kinase [Brachybacterium faecium]